MVLTPGDNYDDTSSVVPDLLMLTRPLMSRFLVQEFPIHRFPEDDYCIMSRQDLVLAKFFIVIRRQLLSV